MVEQFEMLPRRKLLQVRHSPGSLSDKYFLANLEKLLSVDEPEGDVSGSSAVVAQEKPSSEEQERIAYKRAIERSEFLVDKGLTYERDLLDDLATLDGKSKQDRQRRSVLVVPTSLLSGATLRAIKTPS